jgi:hypothetical protein
VGARSAEVAPASFGSAGDPTLRGGTLQIRTAPKEFRWAMPSIGWTALGRGRGYRYRDAAGTHGPVGEAVLEAGRKLEIVVHGEVVDPMLVADPARIEISLTTGIRSHCMEFDGELRLRPGWLLHTRKAPPPKRCPAPVLAPD